jgi:O-antigen/teichoic acid export membrane protein
VQNSALAFGADFITKISALVVLTVAGRSLPLRQFASVGAALAYASILLVALDGGAQLLIMRDGARTPEDRGRVFRELAHARLPICAAMLLGAAAIGLAAGNLAVMLGTTVYVIAGAALTSLTGILRASQDLMPESVVRLGAAMASVAAAALTCTTLSHRAGALMVALAIASIVPLGPLALVARRRARFVRGDAAWPALRRAFPLGLTALAAVLYFRSGTIAVSILSTPAQTSRFTIASSLAVGSLLPLANAVQTALTPRLASMRDLDERARLTRLALRWTIFAGAPIAAIAAVLGEPAIRILFGARFAPAGGPFAILCAEEFLIAVCGILGTALIVAGAVRPVVHQTFLSLALYLPALAILVPPLGAYGAALAELPCGSVALVFLLCVIRTTQREVLFGTSAPRRPRRLFDGEVEDPRGAVPTGKSRSEASL